MGQKESGLRILVTGGHGFVGGALVRALIRSGGHRVSATVRRPAPELEALGVHVISADLTERQACFRATSGQDLVFHTAAKAGVWGSFADYHSINVDATAFLLEGAREHGVRYFVHTSSPSVTFAGHSSLQEDESAPYSPQPMNPYCFTKILAEKLVLSAHNSERLHTLALRPHLIYGPGDPHLLPRVFEAAERGRLLRIGDGSNWVDVTHIEDVVRAHMAVLEHLEDLEAWGKPYLITSGKPLQLWKWLDQLLLWKGLPPVRRSLGQRPAVALGSVVEWIYRLLSLSGEPPLTRFSALQLGCSHTYSIEEARRRLGFEPSVDPYAPFDEQFTSSQGST